MLEVACKIIFAIHPHWRSELQLSVFGGVIKHALYEIVGTYVESGPIILVDWQNLGKEEFLRIDEVYYHISLLQNIEAREENAHSRDSSYTSLSVIKNILIEKDQEIARHISDFTSVNCTLKRMKADYDALLKTLLCNKALDFEVCRDASESDYKTPLVSAIIPTRNRCHLLEEAVSSILDQSYRNIEIIIIDDASVDQTSEIVKKFGSAHNIKYAYANCKKSTAARNIGLSLATGDYVAYLDDDNMWFPSFISYAVSFLEHHRDIDLVYGILAMDNNFENDEIFIYRNYDRRKLEESNYIDTNVMVHRAGLVNSNNAWDEHLSRLGDWDFVLNHTSEKNTASIPVLAAYYRTNANDRNTLIYDLTENANYIRRKYIIKDATEL